jgi:hypothetical protein
VRIISLWDGGIHGEMLSTFTSPQDPLVVCSNAIMVLVTGLAVEATSALLSRQGRPENAMRVHCSATAIPAVQLWMSNLQCSVH